MTADKQNTSQMPCSCGDPRAEWRTYWDIQRHYCCGACWSKSELNEQRAQGLVLRDKVQP